MKTAASDWWRQHRPEIERWVCWVLFFCGVLGLALARGTDQRSALATMLLNLSAAIVAAAGLFTVIAAFVWLILRKPAARNWTVSGGAVTACALLALAGTGSGANTLRLESALRLQIGPDFVFVGGAMPRNLVEQLEAAVHPSLALDRVILSNAGGSVKAAMETAAWLKARGVSRAVVEGDCASACAFLALLMPERYLTPGAALGFHDLWGRGAHSKELLADRAAIFAAFEANGIDTRIMESLMSGHELRYPDRAELLAQRLVTGCWSQERRAPEPCEGSATRL